MRSSVHLMMEIVVPMRPTPLARVRFGRGRVFNPRSVIIAKNTLKIHMVQAMKRNHPLDKPLCLSVQFVMLKAAKPTLKCRAYPTKRPDLDNLLKLVLDAGNAILWKDDATIVELHVTKCYGEKEAVILNLKEIAEACHDG